MIFFSKKSKIILDCFTTDELVASTAPVDKSVRYLPEWWKSLDHQFSTDNNRIAVQPTIRSCPGFTEHYANSITVPLWCEAKIEVFEDKSYSWIFSDMDAKAVVHPIQQYKGFVNEQEYGHLKIESPWQFRCKEDIDWIWSPPTYDLGNIMDKVFILPGVNNYNKNTSVNINLLLNIKQPSVISLRLHQPLVHITPMTDKQFEVRRHVISESEFNRIHKLNKRTTFFKSYKRNARSKEMFKNCPYTGGSNE